MQAHRGALILTLGVLSFLLCFPLGPVAGVLAWFLGSSDLAAMRAGTMDPGGLGTTEAGRMLGLIGAILTVLLFLLWLVFFVAGVLVASHATSHV